MHTIKIKPLSVNECFQGRRYKTTKYLIYQQALLLRLPRLTIPEGKLHITYHVGYSNPTADLGNMEKPFTDILCKKYGFDDRDVYRFTLTKEVVKKGYEFIQFKIEAL